MNVLQNFWVKDHRQIYLIGNPMIWWLSTASVAGYIAVRGFLILRAQRGYRDFENSKGFYPSRLHGLYDS
jgi:dolichyl-phosphate-mannose-protein mannosyltransferase